MPLLEQAEAVLQGRARLPPDPLLDLIQAVNPTGRGLPAAEEERRYAIKSQLQSALLRRFGDALQVHLEPGEAGVLSIRHPASGRSACHARIDALDEDVRAQVQRRLDAGEEAARSAERPAAQRRVGRARAVKRRRDLLSQGREARDSFDYERARACFSAALQRSGGAAGPARLLLDLLVDVLGADEEALQLRAQLSEAALQQPAVRLRLALAEARSGAEEEARALLGDREDGAAAPVHLELGRRALARGELDVAEAALARVRALDPALAEGVALLAEVSARRAALRQPAEATLQRLLAEAEGGGEGAQRALEAEARAVLREWPGNALASKVLRRLEEQRAQQHAQALLREAEEALCAGDGARAALLSRRVVAQTTGPLRERAAALLMAHAQQERRALEAAQLGRALQAAHGQKLWLCLELLDGMSAELRERAQGSLPEAQRGFFARWLPALEVLRAQRPDAPARTLTEALRALHGAEQQAEPVPELLRERLAPYEKHLVLLPEYGRLQERLQGLAQQQRRRQQEEQTARMRAMIDRWRQDDQTLEAPALYQELVQFDRSLLPEAERADLEQGLRMLDDWLDYQARLNKLRTLMANHDYHEAQDVARELQARYPDRTRYQQVMMARLRLFQRLRHGVSGLPSEEEGGVDADAPFDDTDRVLQAVQETVLWLREDGQVLWFCVQAAELLFVRELSVPEGRLLRLFVIRLPNHTSATHVCSCGQLLWVFFSDGGAVGLSPQDLTPMAGKAPEPPRPKHRVYGRFAVPVGMRWLWLGLEKTRMSGLPTPLEVRVIDRTGRLSPRSFADRLALAALPALTGEPEDARVYTARKGVLTVHTAAGAVLREVALEGQFITRRITQHPQGRGVLLWGGRSRTLEETLGGPFPVEVLAVSAEGEAGEPWSIPGIDGDLPCFAAAVDTESGCGFLLISQPEDDHLLLALGVSARGLEERYRVPVDRRSVLVQGPRGGPVYLMQAAEQGVRMARLGAEPPPPLPRPRTQPGDTPSQTDAVSWCLSPFGARLGNPRMERWARRHAEGWDNDLKREVEQYKHAHGEPGGALVYHVSYAISEEQRTKKRAPTAKAERSEDPVYKDSADAWSRQPTIGLYGQRPHPESVLRLLEAVQPETLAEADRRHYHHLYALMLLRLARGAEAREHVVAGLRYAGPCKLEVWLDCLTPLPVPLADADFDDRQPPWRQLHGMVQRADEHLARGQHREAARVLERRVLWEYGEMQSLARLATAWLDLEPESAAERYRRLFMVALYRRVEMDFCTSGNIPNLPFVGRAWSAAELRAVATRCRALVQQHIDGQIERYRQLLQPSREDIAAALGPRPPPWV